MLKKLIIVALTAAVSFTVVTIVASVDADTIWYGSNGYKIYVSPAKHSPDNVGCNGHQESSWMQTCAYHAAAGLGYDLVARGYSVRLGSGDYVQNTNSSNSWGADYHIPMHSNASSPWDCTAPYDYYNSGASGTLLMYYPGSSGGSGLSTQLVSTIGSQSPGTGQDKKRSSTCCLEITGTNAYCAYLETAFHTFEPDAAWIRTCDDSSGSWTWRVGYGVDLWLGYP